jgi:hypothetical protein
MSNPNPGSPLLEPQPGISRMIHHFLSQYIYLICDLKPLPHNSSAPSQSTYRQTMSTVTVATKCGLYSHHNTRSNSTRQATHPVKSTGHKKPNMTLKSLTPDLQLNKNECIPGPKASPNTMQEVDKDNMKPVDLQASATAAVIPANSNPLYDESPQHDGCLTSSRF